MLDHNLLEIIACPVCKGKLHYDKPKQELVCKFDRLAYQINDGIPVLIEEKARELSLDEVSS
ncbi:Trm112 family protein [Motilimonas eburnea]|uniref:Trm112 family protein n=1 Tax=Motilimonas eburnea TaxID=1737488 RepID=UPI001E4DFC25|nr:Trm112 family protein [Motilimonas eburnea]MCE2572507.1 Trm112 family protein [Motilimonas eburnea]